MDPNQTLSDALRLLSNAYETGDRTEIDAAFEALSELKEWLDRGGAVPKVVFTGTIGGKRSAPVREFTVG